MERTIVVAMTVATSSNLAEATDSELPGAVFAWAQACAHQVARPLRTIIRGGPRNEHLVQYRVVAVQWHHWQTGAPLGRPDLHLTRTFIARGRPVARDERLVGAHPYDARGVVTGPEPTGPMECTSESRHLAQIAREASHVAKTISG